jgi:hypothetical protein
MDNPPFWPILWYSLKRHWSCRLSRLTGQPLPDPPMPISVEDGDATGWLEAGQEIPVHGKVAIRTWLVVTSVYAASSVTLFPVGRLYATEQAARARKQLLSVALPRCSIVVSGLVFDVGMPEQLRRLRTWRHRALRERMGYL